MASKMRFPARRIAQREVLSRGQILYTRRRFCESGAGACECHRTLSARSLFLYGITGITSAMSMRRPGIGSQYLLAMLDADKLYGP
jgi:hypothetical protein